MKFIILFACLTIASSVYAQDSLLFTQTDTLAYAFEDEIESEFAGANDTLKITARSFSPSDIDKLKADPDLNYQQPPTVAESLWDRLKRWIRWFIGNLFEQAVTTDLGRLTVYIIAAILIIVVVMMLLKVNAFKVFYSGADQAKQPYKVFHENIHEMNFEKLIQEASAKKEFRLATRLVFLHALKMLSDKHLIEFNPGKTNHDFVEELKVTDLKIGLSELSFYFEYAWYGNFLISDKQFEKIMNTFTDWRTKIG